MKHKLLIITIILLGYILTGCSSVSNQNEKQIADLLSFGIGKNLAIEIPEDEIVDATHLKKVLDGEIQKETPYFDIWNDTELLKLIEYMEDNNYMIVPGRYVINQAWKFSDGKFLVGIGEEREVLKFINKDLWNLLTMCQGDGSADTY